MCFEPADTCKHFHHGAVITSRARVRRHCKKVSSNIIALTATNTTHYRGLRNSLSPNYRDTGYVRGALMCVYCPAVCHRVERSFSCYLNEAVATSLPLAITYRPHIRVRGIEWKDNQLAGTHIRKYLDELFLIFSNLWRRAGLQKRRLWGNSCNRCKKRSESIRTYYQKESTRGRLSCI